MGCFVGLFMDIFADCMTAANLTWTESTASLPESVKLKTSRLKVLGSSPWLVLIFVAQNALHICSKWVSTGDNSQERIQAYNEMLSLNFVCFKTIEIQEFHNLPKISLTGGGEDHKPYHCQSRESNPGHITERSGCSPKKYSEILLE